MKKILLILAAVMGFAIAANASAYSVNDAEIDALIDGAVEVSAISLNLDAMDMDIEFDANATAISSSSKSSAVSIILCAFLGGFGIHRHYMGTAPFMWAAYTFTLGGICGIVPFVDFIVMLVDLVEGKGISSYAGSTKFLMWA